MKIYIFYVSIIGFFVCSKLFAGCMKSEINQLDAKLKDSNISEEKKSEISKLRNLVVENEHSNSELAFESYERAISLLN